MSVYRSDQWIPAPASVTILIVMLNEIPGYIRAAILSAILVAVTLWVPVTPAAASTIPPDYSAVDQYTEGYPGAGGNEQPSVDRNPKQGSSLPEKTVERFNEAGPVGVATAALADLTAPSRSSDGSENGGQGRESGKNGGQGRESAKNNGGSGLDAATSTGEGSVEVARQALGVSGSGGMGISLPIILIIATVLAVGYSVSQKRA